MMALSRIRERRQQLGMTQQRLAALTGIDQATLSKIEKSDGNPTASNIVKLVQALGCSADWLLGLSNKGTSELPGELNEVEHAILTLVHTKPLDKQQKILDILRLLD